MKTLDAPLYEVNQESTFYKNSLEKRNYHLKISVVIGEIAEAYGFDQDDFRYYGPFGFGFLGSSDAYDLMKEHLVKNSDRNGVYTFKKISKPYKDISARLLSIPEINFNPFQAHDVFGANNLIASQWVEERLFYGVKVASETEYAVTKRAESAKEQGKEYVEAVVSIDHKDYLRLILDKLEKDEAKKEVVAS